MLRYVTGVLAAGATALTLLASPQAHAQSGEPIKIGLGMAMTGGLAGPGKQALLGVQIWEEQINKKGGRDHWGDLTPLVVAGGGMKVGQVIGKSDSQGGRPAADPLTPANLVATVLHFLFDVPRLRLRTDIARDLKPLLDNGEPIRQLV